MLETNPKYIQVGVFCDDCDQCYPIFRNIENGTILYENDDTCDLYTLTEINGSDDMSEVNTNQVICLINQWYSNGVRGVIPFSDGRLLCIYKVGEYKYKFGIQPIYDYYHGTTPELEDMDIEDYD